MADTGVSSEPTSEVRRALGVDMNLEVVTLPVADVDRAKSFYESLGWRLDIDLVVSDEIRTVQFTPPHSGCSIQIGKGRTTAEPGSAQGMILVVEDIDAARADLIGRGVDVSEVQEARPPGFDSPGRSYFARASFSDPDGNSWELQEITDAAPRPGVGGLRWTSPRWQTCCTRLPGATARSRRSPHRTTGGTGTPPTWTLARAGALRTRPPRPPIATWRR